MDISGARWWWRWLTDTPGSYYLIVTQCRVFRFVLFQMSDQGEGEVICLDDSSDEEPQHRDMGVGTNDRQEDVAIVDSKEGVLDSLNNVAVTRENNEVGPSDRAFWGKGDEDPDSDEVQIVDTKEVRQTILEVREKDMGVGTRDREKVNGAGTRVVKEGVAREREVGVGPREKDVAVGPSHPAGHRQMIGLHKNPSGQTTLNFGSKVRRKGHSVEKKDGVSRNIKLWAGL